jgi:glutamine synthetase
LSASADPPRAAPSPPSTGFVQAHGLWTREQRDAAAAIPPVLEQRAVQAVRLSFPDLAGLPRGKSFTAASFVRSLERGFAVLAAPLLLGSADERVYDSLGAAPPLGIPQFAGSANMVVVPDPLTMKLLPWAPGTAWLVGDCYFPDGTPVPLASRGLMRHAVDAAHEAGYEYVAGLEVEMYLFRLEDPSYGPWQLGGGPGSPADPPRVRAVGHGYKYLLENHLDELDEVLGQLRSHLLALGLPLRGIDDEWGPGQLEFVFDPLPGVAAADAMFLFRAAAKQVCRRLGYLASFMCQPRIPACCTSGWHLHQSLVDLRTGANAFAPAEPGEPLSPAARHFVGGLLDHAAAASVFATPTVNGYRRRRPFSLAPDRATWGVDHRGVMVRVWGAADPGACHVENRVGEPAANPYLYMASQIHAGLDGMERGTDPGPASTDPYRDARCPSLPGSLEEALQALDADAFYRAKFGEPFVRHVVAQKRSELARFAEATRQADASGAAGGDGVTEWEEREYFELL